MKGSDDCLLLLALRRGSRRLCWQSSVCVLKGYPRTEPRRSAANFHPIALTTTPDLPVTWEALIWGKNFPSNCRKQHFNVIASTSASFLQCQGFGLELVFISGPDFDDPRGSTSSDELPSDQNSRIASSCGSDRTSILAPGSREVPRVRKSFPRP